MSILRYLTGMKNSLPDPHSKKVPQRFVREVLEAMHNEGKIKKHGKYTK